jgi:hypothetical protein
MLVPTNAQAEAIAKFRQEIFGYETQIQYLTDQIEKNNQIIAALEPDATWEEDTPPVIVDPDVILAPPSGPSTEPQTDPLP